MRSQGAVCFFVPRTAPDRRDFDRAKGKALFSGGLVVDRGRVSFAAGFFLARLVRGVSF